MLSINCDSFIPCLRLRKLRALIGKGSHTRTATVSEAHFWQRALLPNSSYMISFRLRLGLSAVSVNSFICWSTALELLERNP